MPEMWTENELKQRLWLLDEPIRLHGDGEISSGRLREIIKEWISGNDYFNLPSITVPAPFARSRGRYD